MSAQPHLKFSGFYLELLLKQIIHDFLFLAEAAILLIEAKPFLAILVEGHLSNIPMKFK